MENIKESFRGEIHYLIALDFLSKMKEDLKLLEVGSQNEAIRSYLPKNIHYSSLDMFGNPDYKLDLNHEKIPVKDRTFDILICLETLEHTLYPKRILKELKRVTKEKGIFILSLPNDYNFWLRLNYLFGIKSNLIDEPFEVVEKLQHIHRLRVKDIMKFFSENFDIIKVVPVWQSRFGAKNKFFNLIDKIPGFLCKIYPSFFARLIVVIAKNKL
jgi:SAM-dependent methyltransferase